MVGNTKTGTSFGLVFNHAYSIINSYTVRLNNDSTVDLIKLRNPYAIDSSLSSLYSDNEASWNNVSLAERARVGYILNAGDGDFFMTKEQFNISFSTISWNPILEGWTRSYFLKLDDTFVNPGKNINGGSKYTRHEFSITTNVDQDAIFTINTHAVRSYPFNTCMNSALTTINSVKNVVEWFLPGSNSIRQTFYVEGDFNLNGGRPYALKAGTTYAINLELWGDNPNITRDFSIVAFGKRGEVKITHRAGLTSDHYFQGDASTI
jgi:hypothetical protein